MITSYPTESSIHHRCHRRHQHHQNHQHHHHHRHWLSYGSITPPFCGRITDEEIGRWGPRARNIVSIARADALGVAVLPDQVLSVARSDVQCCQIRHPVLPDQASSVARSGVQCCQIALPGCEITLPMLADLAHSIAKSHNPSVARSRS